jgi:colanic acid biosynthesis glycosyl transferase WcaI
MKLLILGLNYAPEPVGIGPYTSQLAEDMAARGHAVQVVAGKPYYPQWRPYEGQPKGRTDTTENGVDVTRVPHYVPVNPTGARRLVHHASFALSARSPLMAKARQGADLVMGIVPSLMAVPVAIQAARAARAPLWLHVQDFEVEAAFATNLVSGIGFAERAAHAVESRLLRSADMVSTISPQMCAKLQQKGVPADRVFELRNWSNATFATGGASCEAYRREWNIEDRRVALYSGNIANKQGIEIVIEAAHLLSNRNDLVFVICGEGPNRARLAELAAGLPNVQLHDLQPAERMGELLSLASVHLLPQLPGAADLVLPSKLTNMLQSGRPVVATAALGTGLHAEVEGCGLLTEPGNAEALAAAIATLLDDPTHAAQLGEAASRRARERWSRPAILDGFEAAALRIVQRGGT